MYNFGRNYIYSITVLFILIKDVSVLLLAVFLMGICFENDKNTTKRKVEGEEMKMVQSDKRLTVIGKGREILNWSRGAKPRNDMDCSSIGGICQSNIYICQGRYLKDKCRGEKSRQCCAPGLILHFLTRCNVHWFLWTETDELLWCFSAAAWSALCAGSHHNRLRACDSYGCGGFNSRRYFRSSLSWDIIHHILKINKKLKCHKLQSISWDNWWLWTYFIT